MTDTTGTRDPASVVMVGASHCTTTIELLERLVIPPREQPAMLAALARIGCTEGVVVSTGSRTEIYAAASGDPDELVDDLLAALATCCEVPVAELERVCYAETGAGPARHLLRAAAGLDSRVLHDADIAHQLAAAAVTADRSAMLGPNLQALFAATGPAATVAARLAPWRCAWSWAVAVGLAAAARPRRGATPRVLVLGHGRAEVAVLAQLTDQGLDPDVLDTPPTDLTDIDLVVCVSPDPAQAISPAMARAATGTSGRRLTIVDGCLPRAVDPTVADVRDVVLLNLDDLDDDPEARHRLWVNTATVRSALDDLLTGRDDDTRPDATRIAGVSTERVLSTI